MCPKPHTRPLAIKMLRVTRQYVIQRNLLLPWGYFCHEITRIYILFLWQKSLYTESGRAAQVAYTCQTKQWPDKSLICSREILVPTPALAFAIQTPFRDTLSVALALLNRLIKTMKRIRKVHRTRVKGSHFHFIRNEKAELLHDFVFPVQESSAFTAPQAEPGCLVLEVPLIAGPSPPSPPSVYLVIPSPLQDTRAASSWDCIFAPAELRLLQVLRSYGAKLCWTGYHRTL